jgi:hypothetical protein
MNAQTQVRPSKDRGVKGGMAVRCVPMSMFEEGATSGRRQLVPRQHLPTTEAASAAMQDSATTVYSTAECADT